MDKTPFLSVVTASFNARRTIGNTLASLCGQSFPDFEHIVVDGGSADGTIELLEKYQPQYPLRWISEPDHGIADALNKGVALARGKYVLVLHADDALSGTEVLQQTHALLVGERYDVYSFPVLVVKPGDERYPYRPIRIRWWYRFKTIIPHQGAFVHRRVFERIGGFRTDLKIGMDYDFFYRALNHDARVRFGRMVVACMGGSGASADPERLAERLEEEFAIQRANECHAGWRAAQAVWRALYAPYKRRWGRSPSTRS